jgi:hypothetical protein
MKEGAWFQNCHYPDAYTVTAAGHASVATGTSANRHGLVGNDWYSRAEGATVNCVATDRYGRIPPRPADGPTKKPRGASPTRLLAPTLADALKGATRGQGRVVSLSWKDRSAILPGGQKPDACYWVDSDTGTFITSTYYRDAVHPWVAEFNVGRPADRWFGKAWPRLRDDLDYGRYSGPDDVQGEGQGVKQGRTFPHPMGRPPETTASYYGSVYNSPFGNELLLGLACRAVDAERLGSRNVPDLLSVSFSCNDPVGHCWGPDSQEVLDITLRADLILKELLSHLDRKVGRGRYVVALTSDHGVSPLPEVSRQKGREAGRIEPALLRVDADEFLDKKFGGKGGKAHWVEATAGPWIYLNHATMKRHGIKLTEVEDALVDWLGKQKGIQAVYTRTQLTAGVRGDDALGQSVRRSFHPERAGDLFVLPRPYYVLSSRIGTGTNHGTPHEYDTHVPLLVYGPGILAGVRKEAVTPQATAAILARALEIKAPADAEATVPDKLFEVPTP